MTDADSSKADPGPNPKEPLDAAASAAEGDSYKMTLGIEVASVGPCRKHVRVRVARKDIDHFANEVVKEMMVSTDVPGFRKGHVPRSLVEKRFRKEVNEHVRRRLLLSSLQQLEETTKVDAINEPDLDFDQIEIPADGDLTYEFEVEVRPEFELPNYTGLKIRRPVRDITDDDVARALREYLEEFATVVPLDGAAEPGDILTANLRFTCGEQELGRVSDRQIRLLPLLRFADAEVKQFDELMKGVQPGETRVAETVISVEAPKAELRGETVRISFEVTDVKRLKPPELNAEFLAQVQCGSVDELRDKIKSMLERRLAYAQRQAAREQILEQITASANWDLPESLVKRQVENALMREQLEMEQSGFTVAQIRARQNQMRQQQISQTRLALKQHFILDKLAQQEKIEVAPTDREVEIAYMAMQRGESPRRVRSRLEKQGLLDNLDAQILERKAIELILARAVYEDVPAAGLAAQEAAEGLDLHVSGNTFAPAPVSMLEEPAAAG
jgi:trigger factor